MTETLSRPARSRPGSAERALDQRLLRAALPAAGGAAVRGLAPVTLVVLALWGAEDRARGGLAGALRGAAELWLLSHGARVELAGVHVGLLPLGLTLLPLLLLARAGTSVATRVPACRPTAIGAALAAPYTVAAVLVAALADQQRSALGLASAAVAAALVALAGGTAGAVRARTPGGDAGPVRARLADAATGGGAAVGLLLGASALLTAVVLALHGTTATHLASTAEPGAVGGLGLLLVGASLAPNAVVCAASWLAGPGFAVGTGTTVTPAAVDLGPVPALPLLAGLPHSPLPTGLALLALLVPVLCGAAGGAVLDTRRPCTSWPALLRDAGACGAAAGGLLGVLALAAGGPVGSGRLAAVGPSAWRVALAVGAEVAVGAALGLALRGKGRGTPSQV